MNCDIILQDNILTTKQKQLYVYVSKFEHKINPCDLKNIIKYSKTNEGSGSDYNTVIFGLLKVNSEKVVLKMVFNNKGDKRKDNDEDLLYNVTNSLLLNNNTPHLIFKYGSLRCENFKAPPELKEILESYNKDTKLLTTIVLENGYRGNKTKMLYEILKQKLSLKDKLRIVFQIMWTLECFIKIGFQHNDLHFGNILISTLKTPETFTYKYKDTFFQIKTKYVVKIFDFDRSTKRPTKFNKTKIDNRVLVNGSYCYDFGQCNEITNNKFDLFMVLRNLIEFQNFEKWVLKFTTEKTIYTETVWQGISCKDKGYDKRCELLKFTDAELKPVSYILENGFNEFKVKNKDSTFKVIYTLPN